MIKQTRSVVAHTVNAGITFLYWRIGKRIQMEVLQHARAEYGKGILATLSQELSDEFGPGYSYSTLTRMVKFAEVFPEGEIVATLSQQLSWSHFRQLLPLDLPLQRDFYADERIFVTKSAKYETLVQHLRQYYNLATSCCQITRICNRRKTATACRRSSMGPQLVDPQQVIRTQRTSYTPRLCFLQ